MENLNVLSKETLEAIAFEQDLYITYLEEQFELQRKELKGMTYKRDYWRSKYNDTKIEKRIIAVPEEKPQFKEMPKKFKAGESEDPGYRPGNYKRTKHIRGSFSKKSGEVLVAVRVKDGEIFEFTSKKEAIKYLRELGYKGGFTNLSRAARGSGVYEKTHKAYGHVWHYEIPEIGEE